MDQYSPFTTPQSPAIGSLLMPPPSQPPPSLPPPLTNERPNETPPHHSSLSGGMYPTASKSISNLNSNQNHNPLSAQHSLSFTGSMLNLPTLATPFSAQGPSTPLNLASVSNDSHLQPTLQNIVSTVNLGCTLELKKIALYARNAEYNPKRFAAVIMRIRSPRTTALIFSSGKMVCTGAKSEDDSRLAARKYARIIQKLGFPVS